MINLCAEDFTIHLKKIRNPLWHHKIRSNQICLTRSPNCIQILYCHKAKIYLYLFKQKEKYAFLVQLTYFKIRILTKKKTAKYSKSSYAI